MSGFDHTNKDHQVTNVLIVRSGFTQHKGSAGSGCTGLYAKLRYEFSGQQTLVMLEPWKGNTDHTAEFVYRLGRKGPPPNVAIFGYSWGCGFGFVQLAKSLQRLGIDVKSAVLCDPVLHHGFMKWRAFMPWRPIWIPSNVDEVWKFYQTKNMPRGHKLKRTSRFTIMQTPVKLNAKHSEMDNQSEWHDKCLEVAYAMVNP
jgi:pimeloyl-ACP methyl ester carboxylesterase